MSKPSADKMSITFDAAAMRNISLSSNLKSIDEALIAHVKEPEDQFAVLMMAAAFAFGRIRRKHKITRAKRKYILKKAVGEFEAKVRKFGFNDEPDEAEVPSSES